MSERIRYKEVSDGVVESVQVLSHPTNGGQYKIRLNIKEGQYLVLDAGTELVAASDRFTSVVKLKSEARKALAKLGVELTRGVRTKKSAE